MKLIKLKENGSENQKYENKTHKNKGARERQFAKLTEMQVQASLECEKFSLSLDIDCRNELKLHKNCLDGTCYDFPSLHKIMCSCTCYGLSICGQVTSTLPIQKESSKSIIVLMELIGDVCVPYFELRRYALTQTGKSVAYHIFTSSASINIVLELDCTLFHSHENSMWALTGAMAYYRIMSLVMTKPSCSYAS